MNVSENIFLICFLGYSLACSYLGFKNAIKRKNPYGLTRYFSFLGAFVWADAITFGIFFSLASLISLIFQNLILFCLIYSVFWVVRSVGETIYWFLEQFANPHRNKPRDLKFSKYFPGESIYIHYQIFWQCIAVISIIASIYFFALWL